MDIHTASEIVLRLLHDDLEGKLEWSVFLSQQTRGLDDRKATELRGTYAKALIVLIDEGLCKKAPNSDIVQLAKKGIEAKGDYRKYVKKRKTINTLEKLRRIAPIVSAIVVIITFIITILKKNADTKKAVRQRTYSAMKPKDVKEAKEPKKQAVDTK